MIHPTRRNVLGGMAALALARPARAATDAALILRAEPGRVQLAPEGYPRTDIWGYGGTAPGAGIRARQGDRITRLFENAIPRDSSVHWHGIRLPNAMDGVPGMTQPPVPEGGTFLYDFALPDAGTFWYHPHLNSLEQVGRGLTAPLIVDEAEPPEVDADLTLMLNDWRLDAEARIAEGWDDLHDRAHAGRIGNYMTVNGRPVDSHAADAGARLRLRIINAATDRIVMLGTFGLRAHLVALDGMPLADVAPVEEVLLGPAQRADLIADVAAEPGERAYLTMVERDGAYEVLRIEVGGRAGAALRPAPAPLPPNPVADPVSDGARGVDLVMAGGAMGRMGEARTADGILRPMGDLAQRGLVWSMNGVAGMAGEPLAEIARGETLRIRMVNDTAWPHAMHLHGHHFREVTEAGPGPLRDTLLMLPDERREIAFAADNPGDWMVHCHMLSHQAGGMMAWLRVLG